MIVEESAGKIRRLIRGYELWASECTHEKTWDHYASDEQGSIRYITSADEVCNFYEYDVWGNTVRCEESIPNRYRYTGQQYDPVTQQYYLRARYYNPVIARFTQEDEYRGDGLNLYAYCDNNPVMYVDPSGYCKKDPVGKALKFKANEYGYFGDIGQSGNSEVRNIRGGNRAALEFFELITKDFKEERVLGNNKIMRYLKDDTVVLYRRVSHSDGTPAIDINKGNTYKKQKIHFID